MFLGQIFNPNLGPGPGPGPRGPRWAGFGENQKDAQRNSASNDGYNDPIWSHMGQVMAKQVLGMLGKILVQLYR